MCEEALSYVRRELGDFNISKAKPSRWKALRISHKSSFCVNVWDGHTS